MPGGRWWGLQGSWARWHPCLQDQAQLGILGPILVPTALFGPQGSEGWRAKCHQVVSRVANIEGNKQTCHF